MDDWGNWRLNLYYHLRSYHLSSGQNALSPIDGISTPAQASERFSITSVTSGNYAETYVNDVQNGEVWMLRGQVSQTPALIPCVYQLVNGETTPLPMERHSEISLLANKVGQTTTVNDSQAALDKLPPTQLPPDMQKKLDDSSKKMDEDMKKLFPQ